MVFLWIGTSFSFCHSGAKTSFDIHSFKINLNNPQIDFPQIFNILILDYHGCVLYLDLIFELYWIYSHENSKIGWHLLVVVSDINGWVALKVCLTPIFVYRLLRALFSVCLIFLLSSDHWQWDLPRICLWYPNKLRICLLLPLTCFYFVLKGMLLQIS